MGKETIATIAILVIGLVLFSGCTQPPTGQATLPSTPSSTLKSPSTACNAETIQTFSYAEEGDLIRFYFILQNSAGAKTICGGQANFSIVDDQENEVYSSNFSVNTNDFVDYMFQLTGQEMGKAYEWRIEKSDLKKGYSQWGTAKIEFSTTSKKLTSETPFMDIQPYAKEEIEKIDDEKFSKIATTIGQNISKGNFSVTVERAGFVSKSDYTGKKDYLRVDIKVKNNGSEKEYFSTSGMVIIAGNKQYESSWLGGTLTFSDMYPGIEQEGYILFEVPKTVTDMKLVFELGYDSFYDKYLYEYQISLD